MLTHNFSIISRYSSIYAIRKLHKFDIGYAEFGVLMYLMAHDNVNQDTIARYYMIDKGAVTKTLQKLESKNFIERHVNMENQREKIIRLSLHGQKVVEEMKSIRKEWDDILLKGISKEEYDLLIKITHKLLQNAIDHISGEE